MDTPHTQAGESHPVRSARDLWVMLAVLVLLTAVEVGVALVPGHHRLASVLLLLLAAAQGIYFLLVSMHLRSESATLRKMVAGPLMIAAFYGLVLIADSAWRHLT